ncbi:uncharacterized protein LOC113339027 isoform X2 [Papaver somniferum]|uniref:uncharacterized protein LOC113339027 isoform X2 n=1 Tax=Papaver somniferum TaxID=3469 RepID=UPI000E6FF03A|nr:uncharacterized protein LOC113339027 isoform X2 [Papaver somniferum]
MELTLPSLSFSTSELPKVLVHSSNRCSNSTLRLRSLERRRRKFIVYSSLPETAASIVIAAAVVENLLKPCEDCSGTGICGECKGEGFVVKRMSDERAEKARLSAKNMATRYTAGLPKKWSYCTKCSSSRSCTTCGGRGTL